MHFDEKPTTLKTKLWVTKTVDERVDDTVDDRKKATEEIHIHLPWIVKETRILDFD